MKTKNVFVSFLLMVGLFSACAKDENTVDYRNKQFAEQLARMSAANGEYTGMVYAKQGGLAPAGTPIGAMKVSVKAEGTVLASNGTPTNTDGTPAMSAPSLNATIEFQGNTKISIHARNSSYDPDSGRFQADIVVTPQIITPGNNSNAGADKSGSTITTGNPETISLIGVLDPQNSIKGTIEVDGYSEYGGTVVLNKNSPSLDQLSKMSQPIDQTSITSTGYEGWTTFADGEKKPVIFVLQTPETNPEDDFLYLFDPVKPVLVTFNYGDDAQIPYSNGYWYQNDNRVTGQATMIRTNDTVNASSDTQSVTFAVTCLQDPTSKAFKCNHIQQNNNRIAAVTLVSPLLGPAKEIPDDSTHRDPVVANYMGTGEYNPNQWLSTKLSVIYPARTRLQEIFDLFAPDLERTVQFTFSMNDEIGIAVNFTAVKYDVVNRTIDGTQTETQAGHNFTRYIRCTNFVLGATEYNFTCTYSSSLRAYQIPLVFNSKGTKTGSPTSPPRTPKPKGPKKP